MLSRRTKLNGVKFESNGLLVSVSMFHMKEASNFQVPTDFQKVKMVISSYEEILCPLIPPANATGT